MKRYTQIHSCYQFSRKGGEGGVTNEERNETVAERKRERSFAL